MFGLEKEEVRLLKTLNSPRKIQDFLNQIPINFEEQGDTCMSPQRVLQENKAHCIEGAMLAAAIFRLQGEKPLIIDLEANEKDFDHVVCVFKRGDHWGAISKTNHAVLRYREPVYRSIRELAMSFFHEYFDDNGKKNLRSYSMPVDLSKFDHINWISSKRDVWEVPEHLINVKHYPILTKSQLASLRKADQLEIEAGKIVEWKK